MRVFEDTPQSLRIVVKIMDLEIPILLSNIESNYQVITWPGHFNASHYNTLPFALKMQFQDQINKALKDYHNSMLPKTPKDILDTSHGDHQ